MLLKILFSLRDSCSIKKNRYTIFIPFMGTSKDEVMISKSLFVLTKYHTDLYNDDFLLLLKVLETVTPKVKVDSRLPAIDSRANFALFLVDAAYSSCSELLNEEIIDLAKSNHVALYNAMPTKVHEQTALLANIKGIIYKNDEPENTFKGVRRILSGELWFCRKTMSKTLSELVQQVPNFIKTPHTDLVSLNVLTAREKSVISLLAKGAKNEDIANTLNISCHTVKTHIYSAFRKTKSRNRIELANWAQRFMPAASIVTR